MVSLIVCACTPAGSERAIPSSPSSYASSASAKIKHVVIIVQESRSFENLFAGWPGANAPLEATQPQQRIPYPVKLKSITYAHDKAMCELYGYMTIAYAGRYMNGFSQNEFCKLGAEKPYERAAAYLMPYAYMDHREIAPYRAMAAQYVLADGMFATEWGGDFTAHQDLISGTTSVDAHHDLIDVPSASPWGCDAPRGTQVQVEHIGGPVNPAGYGVFPCMAQYPTMAELLDHAGLSWKYYVAPLSGPDPSGQLWNAFDAIKNVRYGPDWKRNIVSPPSRILDDAGNGSIPAVSWVIPELTWSDHPSQKSDMGPSWIAAVVNAIGESPDWNSTAIVIVWSDWGGWYDNQPPLFPNALQGSGFGFRVPCIIISPYAKAGYVSHTLYNFGSILKFIEQTFKLPSLASLGYGYTFADAHSNSISDSFQFGLGPRPFTRIHAKYPPSTFAGK